MRVMYSGARAGGRHDGQPWPIRPPYQPCRAKRLIADGIDSRPFGGINCGPTPPEAIQSTGGDTNQVFTGL